MQLELMSPREKAEEKLKMDLAKQAEWEKQQAALGRGGVEDSNDNVMAPTGPSPAARDAALSKAAAIEMARWQRHHDPDAKHAAPLPTQPLPPMPPAPSLSSSDPHRIRSVEDVLLSQPRLVPETRPRRPARPAPASHTPTAASPSATFVAASAAAVASSAPAPANPFASFDPFFDYAAAMREAQGKPKTTKQQPPQQRNARAPIKPMPMDIEELRMRQEEEENEMRTRSPRTQQQNTRPTARQHLPPDLAAAMFVQSRRGMPSGGAGAGASKALKEVPFTPPISKPSRNAANPHAPPTRPRMPRASSIMNDPASPKAQAHARTSAQATQQMEDAAATQAARSGMSNDEAGEEHGFMDDDAAAAFEQGNGAAAPAATSFATAGHSASQPRGATPLKSSRGPKSLDASIKANKHPSSRSERARVNEEKTSAAEKVSSKRRAAKATMQANADGKFGLAPEGSDHLPPRSAPAHPIMYLKAFLLRIHPDLFHQAGQKGTTTNSPGQQQPASSTTMVETNQKCVAQFNALLDYYKQIKMLPHDASERIPDAPALPPYPQTLSFYAKVRAQPLAPNSKQPSPEEDDASPRIIRLFSGDFNLSPFDLSSLHRLLGAIEQLLIRLLLASETPLATPSVRARFEAALRARKLSEELWANGAQVDDGPSSSLGDESTLTGLRARDPSTGAFHSSPGRFRKQYAQYYAQTSQAHATHSRARGFWNDKPPALISPTSGEAILPPLLESMLRANLLMFDSSLDHLQRLHTLQSFLFVLEGRVLEDGSRSMGEDSSALYAQLWMGVRITVTPSASEQGLYEAPDQDQATYQYSASEWSIPWNFEPNKFERLVQQWLYAFHGDNEQGRTLL